MVRFLPFLISLVLTVYALFSCIQTRDEDVPHLPKLVWIVLIVFVPFAGPIIWLLMSRGISRPEPPARPSGPPARPVAPDDDPDFLASLDRYRDPRVASPQPDPAPEPEDTRAPEDQKKPRDEDKKKPREEKKPENSESEAPTEPDDGKP